MITKSDYLKFLTCPAYFWFLKFKPQVLQIKELSDFEKELIESGREVEVWVRKLFPGTALVESREVQAVIDTKKLIDRGQTVIFQATIQTEGLYVMVDMLEWDEDNKYWIINETKGSTSDQFGESKSKKEHLYDAGFQYFVLRRAGMKGGLPALPRI
jgi:beta-galactosidase GanA